MRRGFDNDETDYDFEDEYLDCTGHPRNNPRRGLWRTRIHAHRVRQRGKAVGFFVYYSLDSVESIPPASNPEKHVTDTGSRGPA
jgi:hypothetical protein